MEQRLDGLPISVRGTGIKLHELEQKTHLWEGREQGRREEPQTISTLQALTESLMRDNIQLRRRMGNLGMPVYIPVKCSWLLPIPLPNFDDHLNRKEVFK